MSTKQPPPPPSTGHSPSLSQQGGATKLATKGEQKCSGPPPGRPAKPTSGSPPSPLSAGRMGGLREGPPGTAEPLGSRSPDFPLREEPPAPSARPPNCAWKEKQVYCLHPLDLGVCCRHHSLARRTWAFSRWGNRELGRLQRARRSPAPGPSRGLALPTPPARVGMGVSFSAEDAEVRVANTRPSEAGRGWPAAPSAAARCPLAADFRTSDSATPTSLRRGSRRERPLEAWGAFCVPGDDALQGSQRPCKGCLCLRPSCSLLDAIGAAPEGDNANPDNTSHLKPPCSGGLLAPLILSRTHGGGAFWCPLCKGVVRESEAKQPGWDHPVLVADACLSPAFSPSPGLCEGLVSAKTEKEVRVSPVHLPGHPPGPGGRGGICGGHGAARGWPSPRVHPT